MFINVIHRIAKSLSRRSAIVLGVTSRHVNRCGKASQQRSFSPLRYHVTMRGFNGFFADAWSLSHVAIDVARAGPSVRSLQRKREDETIDSVA